MVMTANNHDLKTKPTGRQRRKSIPVVNGDIVYHGALVGSLAGYAVPWADTAGIIFQGISMGGNARNGSTNRAEVTGDTTASIPPEVDVDIAVEVLQVPVTAASTIADVDKPVWGVGDDAYTITDPSSNTTPIGVITRFNSATSFDILLYAPEDYQANV